MKAMLRRRAPARRERAARPPERTGASGARRRLHGWGRVPVEECLVYRPERLSELAELVAHAPAPSLIARGLGRAYGDAALNRDAGVVLGERLDRLLAFDPATGVLACEAGVSLATLLDRFLPRGFFLPVTPGTKFISVGGAIASDVHGKNHHADGSIGRWVRSLRLLTASGEIVRCARDENAELFWATLGGMGLTGIVVEASLQLKPVPTPYVSVDYERLPNLDALLERMSEVDRHRTYAVAWVDGLARGRRLGRGVLMLGDHARPEELPPALRARAPRRPPTVSLPVRLPDATLNPLTVRVFNELFHRVHRERHAVTDCDRYFYPLDRVHHWNRAYGRRGVLQYQALVPLEARAGLVEMLELLSASGLPSFLVVLKRLGEASGGLLSFPRPGFTLSLDLPDTGERLRAVLARLDAIVLRSGGTVYLSKDARLPAEHLPAMYPGLARFRAVRARWDPNRRFSSSLARRLRIDAP